MPLDSFFQLLYTCFTVTGVGIFIAISGWFGIKFTLKGLAKYLFQVLFLFWVIYGIAIASHHAELNLTGIKYSLCLYEGYWFVLGYLGLYIISPILNSFVKHASKKDYQILLASLFIFQCLFSWITAWYDYYNGYSILLFSSIYLAAAYIRKYPMHWLQKHSVCILIASILLMASIAFVSTWIVGNTGRQIRDDNPLAIFVCVLFVLSFSKLKFQKSIVNWLAASCFSVYLIHFNPYVYPHLLTGFRYVFTSFDGMSYAVVLMLILILAYVVCTIFDQLRIIVWKQLCKCMFKNMVEDNISSR
jgi:hypothetical protein